VPGTYPLGMSVIALVLLLAAIALVVATEWPRLAERGGFAGKTMLRRGGKSMRRKQHLRVVRDEPDEDFARSVERDLAALPTIDERDRKKR
jgi:hypothetical protein